MYRMCDSQFLHKINQRTMQQPVKFFLQLRNFMDMDFKHFINKKTMQMFEFI